MKARSSRKAIWTKYRAIRACGKFTWEYESGYMSVLAVKGLNQFYGGSHTLWDVDLNVTPGARMCLMGRNGTGKTTLLKCVMGLQPARSGGIVFDGTDLLK